MTYKGTTTVRTPTEFISKVRYVQSRPYVKPLQYHTYGSQSNGGLPANGEFSTTALNNVINDLFGLRPGAYAKAYDKLSDRLRGESSAMLAVNIAERNQSFDMIGDRAGQLLRALRQFRKFDLPGALGTLGFKLAKPKLKELSWVRTGKGRTHSIPAAKVDQDSFFLRRKMKSVGSLWLEYWFGWSPLLSDIGGAVDVLQDRNPRLRNKFSAVGRESNKSSVRDSYYYDGVIHQRLIAHDQAASARLACTVIVSSPNALKANQLGFVNPATVAWELIPFSFLVDWFLPVGRFLDSYTDFVGLTVQNSFLTWQEHGTHQRVVTGYFQNQNISESAFSFKRLPMAEFHPPGLFDRTGSGIRSLTRGATAIALLTGFLKSSKWS